MGTQMDITYCAGWDPQARQPVGAMSEDRARERDSAGQPYAVLLGAGGRRRALLQVSWEDHYLGVFLFDDQERRARSWDYRELTTGLLHLRGYEEWRHTSADEPEFPERGWHFTLTSTPGDEGVDVVLDDGGSLHTSRDLAEHHRTLRRAEFGDWSAYADGRMLGLDADGELTFAPAACAEQPGPPTVPWSVPKGLRPQHLDALFTPGSRFADADMGPATVTAPRTAGVLRLPTGSVIAADPATLGTRDEPFTVPVPPGEYPVLIATAEWDGEGWGESTAALLRVLDGPTTSWELAVRPGQDPRLLGEGQFYGFGVDTGMGAFLDAAGRDALTAACKDGCEEGETTAPGTDANLIAFHSGRGDGAYPVWIGRTVDGEVSCLVADMLVLHGARPLPPTPPDTTAFLSPPPPEDSPRPRPGSPGDSAEAVAALIAGVADFSKRLRR
ncbi:MAG: DUF4241 domain-containing protein [Streptomyces sp.]|nr:DUF4241 domain-containing protein [Streptomyces sp.]